MTSERQDGTNAGTVAGSTDWLASRPVFYNERSGAASGNINDVIDWRNLEFHPEGLRNYLSFGFSVFQQTPVRHVKFLPPCSRLVKDKDGRLAVKREEDPVIPWLEKTSKEDEVIELIRERVHEWERQADGEILIPTSGGMDSRLLNLLIKDKARIRSFTYGISSNQAESYEVVYARELSRVLNTKWEHIPLGHFHQYLDAWDRRFGPSTHAHGMYHIEFYTKILEKCPDLKALLSGIIGDAWAGSVVLDPPMDMKDVVKLGYSHGIHADSSTCLLRREETLLAAYWEEKRDLLQSPLYRVIEAMRIKIILLSYLYAVPEMLGLEPWSPFLIPEVALSMLTLPPGRRRDREWMKELFARHGVLFEEMQFRCSRQNTLDLQAWKAVRPDPLDNSLLREVIQPDYVDHINRVLFRSGEKWDVRRLLHEAKSLLRLRRTRTGDLAKMKAYNEYMTLRPIEMAIRRRNAG